MSKSYDIAVIGAGPGGYVAAILAAQRGLATCLVEKADLGGVCLNWGCIPSKSLIHNASTVLAARELKKFGVGIDTNKFRYDAVHAASRSAVSELTRGVGALLAKNKVEIFQAKATLAGNKKILLSGPAARTDSITASSIIVATGSHPASLSGFVFDEKHVLSSTGVLSLTRLPASLVILGAGAIGVEFAYVMNAFGVKVTLIELEPRILPREDSDSGRIVQAEFQKSGIKVITAARAVSWKKNAADISIEIEAGGAKSRIDCDQILVAVGRVPNSKGMGLEAEEIACDKRGYVITHDYYETGVAGIYAIGDVIDGPALAHVASRQAEIVIDRITGKTDTPARVDASAIPSAIYCQPQVASFGLREDAVTLQGLNVRKSVFPFRASGKAIAVENNVGQVKILADATTGEILGGHIVGQNATELIHELLLAKTCEMTAHDLTNMVHAHPTLSEAIFESALGIAGRPIHF
jgi:dihydrolipoamide dehydrogenase